MDVDTNTLTDTAEYLYGMIHARYIISLDGLEAMVSSLLLSNPSWKSSSRDISACVRVYSAMNSPCFLLD